MTTDVVLHLGDCREVLPTLAPGSVDAIICDPPYPEIKRPYGRLTEAEWHDLMGVVVPECRRVLKPTGSAVFILQPNSERVGRLRPWLWEFLARWAREWNQVQDVWWWNVAAPPTVHCRRANGLMRPSLKACVWLGPEDCYRDQAAVLWEESDSNRADRLSRRCTNRLQTHPSGQSFRARRAVEVAAERGGVTPFNVLPIPNTDSAGGAGAHGHGAGTPRPLTDWWARYLCPPGGTILDPFLGSGTTGLSALKYGRGFVGIESSPDYYETARRRLADAEAEDEAALPLFD